jgi:hypothetical protein
MIRRLLTIPAVLAIAAVSIVATPTLDRTGGLVAGTIAGPARAFAAGCTTPTKTGNNCTITASVAVTSTSVLTLTVLDNQAYTSNVNTGGTTTVTCNQGASGTPISSSSYLIQYVGSSKSQVTYLMCLSSYKVTDFRGTGSGWHVTFQDTQWTCTAVNGSTGGCTSGATIAAGSTYMDVPTVACGSPPDSCTGNGSLPAIKMTGSVPIDKGAVTVASAASAATGPGGQAQGMGTYTFFPRTDKCGGTGTICDSSTGGSPPVTTTQGQLSLYAPNTTTNGYYKSTLTESLISGP